MIYNIVLISAVQQSDSVIHIYTFFFYIQEKKFDSEELSMKDTGCTQGAQNSKMIIVVAQVISSKVI